MRILPCFFLTGRLLSGEGMHRMTTLYACRNTNEEIRQISSSGGIYYLLAERIILQGGVVYAACYDDDLNVTHRCLYTQQDIRGSCGSKYVWSDIKGVFREIRDRLDQREQVLFVGTPCQAAGLLNYLQKEYENLLCVDFVCHGAPGQAEWKRYRESLQKRGFFLADVNMRGKSSGWRDSTYSWKLTDRNGKVRYEKRLDNVYMQGLIHNVYLTEGCYHCAFKGIERRTDFTLGDFWGIEYLYPEMDDNKGTSLLMVHTEKGRQIFNAVKENLVYRQVTKEDAVSCNKSIISSAAIPAERDIYYAKMAAGGDFIKILASFNRKWKWQDIKSSQKRKLKYKIRKLKRQQWV